MSSEIDRLSEPSFFGYMLPSKLFMSFGDQSKKFHNHNLVMESTFTVDPFNESTIDEMGELSNEVNFII